MKRIFATLLLLAMALALCACGECQHQWTRATCTEPQYCTKCGLSNGSPLGHDWLAATCTEPRTCSRCGETEGAPLGHSFVNGVCERCGETEKADTVSTSTPTPTATPAPTPTPSAAELLRAEHASRMEAQSTELYVPDAEYFLSEPQTKTVIGPGGNSIYAFYKPEGEAADHFSTVKNGTVVTVIAKQNGYALFYTDGGFYAWGGSSMIVDDNDTPYLMKGSSDNGRQMIVSYDKKIYVLYNPYGVFAHFALLSPGDVVTAYKTVNGYTYVECGAVKGWVYSSYLADY